MSEMFEIQHNIVNALYCIKGLAESHAMQVEEGRFQDGEETRRHAEDTLRRIRDKAEKGLLMARTLSCILKVTQKEYRAGRAASIRYAWRQVRKALHKDLQGSGIELVEHIPAAFPVISCQRTELRNILLCLARNAVQEMPRGGKLIIRAELRFDADERPAAVVTIADTGEGIAPEELGQLFQPFFTTKADGNGLGLFITRSLVRKNRGRIAVSSFEGRGTTFQLELPLYRRRYAEALNA